MTHDTRTTDSIERDIAEERSQMSDTMNDLQKKFSIDGIVGDLGDMIRDQGGEVGRAIGRTVGRNPTAVVLVGVGLAWLFIGQARGQSVERTDREQGHDRDTGTRQGSAGHSPAPLPRDRWNDGPHADGDRYWYGNGRMSGDRLLHDRGVDGGARTGNQAGMGTARNGVMGRTHDRPGALGRAASAAAETATSLTDRLSHGLESLSDDARARVLSARRRAHEARLSASAAIDRTATAASGIFDDHPLVVGALALALGAAIGGALSNTRTEDDLLGRSSDELFDDAQALFRQERDTVIAAARAAAADVQGEVREMGSDLGDLVPDGKTVGRLISEHVAHASNRVIERAVGDGEKPLPKG